MLPASLFTPSLTGGGCGATIIARGRNRSGIVPTSRSPLSLGPAKTFFHVNHPPAAKESSTRIITVHPSTLLPERSFISSIGSAKVVIHHPPGWVVEVSGFFKSHR